VKDLLDGDSSLQLTFATDLFVSEMPDAPDAAVCIFDTGGYAPEVDYEYKRPTVQVLVRGRRDGYLAAHALAADILDVLNGLHNETINSTRYIGIWAEGDVISLGRDGNGRPLLSMNFRIHRAST
jgi:hypothetical protein